MGQVKILCGQVFSFFFEFFDSTFSLRQFVHFPLDGLQERQDLIDRITIATTGLSYFRQPLLHRLQSGRVELDVVVAAQPCVGIVVDIAVQLVLALGHDAGDDRVAGDVDRGADHVHQPVHAEDDRHTFDRQTHLGEDHREHHHAHPGHPGCADGRQHRHRVQMISERAHFGRTETHAGTRRAATARQCPDLLDVALVRRVPCLRIEPVAQQCPLAIGGERGQHGRIESAGRIHGIRVVARCEIGHGAPPGRGMPAAAGECARRGRVTFAQDRPEALAQPGAVERQIDVIEDGGEVIQETRLYDADKDETRSMRSKEEANDYRYFPDPDLLPLHLDVEWVAELKDGLPELPDKKMARFLEEYGLSVENANVLVSERDRADFFESVAKGRDPKQAANWVVGDLLGKLNKTGTELVDAKISPSELGHLIDLVNKDAISGRMAKRVFEEMFETGKRADDVVIEQGLTQVSDEGALVGHIREVLDGNVDKVLEYKAGKEKLFGYFVGQVMKATDGKANPKLVNQLLRGALAER